MKPEINTLQKAQIFKELHQREEILIMPNPWDAGSAKMLELLGFEALATTSAGFAYAQGKPDGLALLSLEDALENAAGIVNATSLPVSADMENGFGEDPENCAETVRRAAAIGLAGCSIEDTTGNPENPVLAFELSVERVKAAAEAVKKLPVPFTLTARAENLLYGRHDLKDTIRRLEAFAEAGADVLFAPGLHRLADIEAVVRAVAPRPVNVLLGANHPELSIPKLAETGVKRISVGSSLARAAYSSFYRAAEEIRKTGTFTFADEVISYAQMNALFQRK